jgi:ABC-2 type transport system ATP-binding protein
MVSSSAQHIVEAFSLTKVFKDFWMRSKARAVDGVSFEINRGEIFGLLGPNGSGKSTTIKMILGLLHPTSGRLAVFGKHPSDVVTKKYIGFLPEESYLYRFLNARETLDYYGKLFGLGPRIRKRRTEELLEMVGLTQVAHRAIGEYSKGMTRRIGLAQALVNDPEFLILDEPTSGLDPIGTRQVKDLIIELGRRGKTILLSSHLLADVEDVCDRMVMLYGGKIRAQGTVDELLTDSQRTIIETPRISEETIQRIEQLLQETEHTGIDRVQQPRQRLEQLFLEIVEQARQEQIETAGAQHGGETASFLRGEHEEGDRLISALTEEDAPHSTRAREVKRADVSAPQQTQQDAVLSELTREPQERPTPPRAKEKPAAPAAPPADVDTDLIQTLLDRDDSTSADAADEDASSSPGSS